MSDTSTIRELQEQAEHLRQALDRAVREIERAIVGYHELIEDVFACVLSGGHALLEGVPGLGKTRLVRAFGEVLALKQGRIQFTPDLMPGDVVGTNTLLQDQSGNQTIAFQPGPVFANILLADEINRATPKTQSALLEAMQERQVTVGGATHTLAPPFAVLATQNPIELEGTYPLPEAQLDRFFFKLLVPFPEPDAMDEVLRRTTGESEVQLSNVLDADGILRMRDVIRGIVVGEEVRRFAVRLVYATHPDRSESSERISRYVRYGASPRGAQSLLLAGKVYAFLDGRFHVAPEDVRRAALPSLRHRLILGFRAETENVTVDELVSSLLEEIDPA